MVEAGDASAGAMGECGFCAFDLAFVGFTSKLPGELDELRSTGCADRMAFAQKAA